MNEMPVNHHHHMDHIGATIANWVLTISMTVMAHVFTVPTLQGFAAFFAILSSGFNIFYLIKRNRNK